MKINNKKCKSCLLAGMILMFFMLETSAMAAPPPAPAAEPGKFSVVAGSDDKAYLVDTVSGAVWVLTYRTMATGREPIAIPYKFILRTPKNQGEFLAESTGVDVPLSPSIGR